MGKVTNRNGYSIVELLIALLIFAITTMIASLAFQTIFKKSSMEAKTAETGIVGMLGLEMMRGDIAQAGFGLPWSYAIGATPTYGLEVTGNPFSSSAGINIDAQTFNDNPANTAPWPILSGTDSSTKIDYLVVKSSIGGMNPSSRKWNIVQYAYTSAGNKSYLKMKGDPSTDLVAGDKAITLSTTFSATGVSTKQLVVDTASSGAFSYPVPTNLMPLSAFQPNEPTQTYVAYGINGSNVRMPYNRLDFYVDKGATKPKSCNPNTGVLFKAVADQLGGYVTYPLLDCVGDMQIVYDRDVYKDGTTVLPIDESVIAALRGGTPAWTVDQMRSQIKNVRVYILSHDGKKDPNFSYPFFDSNYAVCVAPFAGSLCNASVGRGWTTTDMATTFGNDWMHYRWKVYSFVVNLKNLQ